MAMTRQVMTLRQKTNVRQPRKAGIFSSPSFISIHILQSS
jgi:hypothetical protein